MGVLPRFPYAFGIEEEYFLIERCTRELVSEPPDKLLGECKAALAEQFSAEYQRSQVEVATKVCFSPAESRTELRRLRSTVVGLSDRYGLAPIAASTHPWRDGHPAAHRQTTLQHHRA
jgi:carboxylate-amine ligase